MRDFKTFMNGVKRGNLKEVVNNFQENFLEMITDYEKRRPIHLACENGHLEIVKFLFQNKCNIECEDSNKWRPIHEACNSGHIEILEFLIKNKCSIECKTASKCQPIHLACYKGHLKIVEFLIQNKYIVDCETASKCRPIHLACIEGHLDIVKYLIQCNYELDCRNQMGFTGLQCATIKGYEDICNELMKNGADCIRYVQGLQQSSYNETIVPISTRENAVTLCMKMHETVYPCFLKVLDSNKVNCCDGNENTLLHMAVKTLQPDLCQTLVNCGANVATINTQGNSPIFELFSQTDCKMVNNNIDKVITISNILINSGADINKMSRLRVTLFERASQWNSERLMLHLLSKHPDLNIFNENDLKLAFANEWFVYGTALIDLMPKDSLKSFISAEIIYIAMKHADSKLLKSMFIKTNSAVQQSIIEDLLRYFADKDEYDAFINLLETKIIEPKLFSNGETLLTGLLKDKNIKYCLAIIHHVANSKCFNLANVLNRIPLQIAIETELYDLICPLIFKCDQLNNKDIYGNTPLLQLFLKLSTSTEISTDGKLMTAVKTIIYRGGDIYRETSTEIKIIEFCSRLDLRIEIEIEFQNAGRNRDSEMNEERIRKNICNICLDKELDCVFDCGHTFCTLCGMQLFRCPMCNRELTNPKRLFIN